MDVFNDDSLEQAQAVDDRIKSGEEPPLAGCVIGIKDNLCMKEKKVTCGSRILENFVSPYSATAIERLEAAGAIIIGKLNMDEFAMGSSNENSYFGPVRNPIDPERGSRRLERWISGSRCRRPGFGLTRTDTGGSIRQPAAFCGVVGLKPTYGRISRYGLVAFASSLDQIGPFGKSVEDVAELLKVVAGHDHRDSTSVETPVPDYPSELEKLGNIKNIRIGIPSDYFGEGLDPEIKTAVMGAIKKLESDGFTIGEVSLPHTPYSVATYYIIANAEASSNLARYDGARYGYRNRDASNLHEMYVASRSDGFGDEVKRRIILGTYVLSAGYYDAYYRKAQKVRRLVYQDFKNAFNSYDVLITPTTTTPAYKIGEKNR